MKKENMIIGIFFIVIGIYTIIYGLLMMSVLNMFFPISDIFFENSLPLEQKAGLILFFFKDLVVGILFILIGIVFILKDLEREGHGKIRRKIKDVKAIRQSKKDYEIEFPEKWNE